MVVSMVCFKCMYLCDQQGKYFYMSTCKPKCKHPHRGVQAPTLSDWGCAEEQSYDGEKGPQETFRGPLAWVRETQELVGPHDG